MNREIKFRGKQATWIYGGVTILNNKATIFDYDCIGNSAYEVEFKSVGQYTGLRDRNGKEIYEGDIIRWGCGFTGRYDLEHWHRYAKVELTPALQFRIIKYFNTEKQQFEKGNDHVFGFSNFIYTDTEKYLEVIGNIHENPEMLNV